MSTFLSIDPSMVTHLSVASTSIALVGSSSVGSPEIANDLAFGWSERLSCGGVSFGSNFILRVVAVLEPLRGFYDYWFFSIFWHCIWWALLDSNQRSVSYELTALGH